MGHCGDIADSRQYLTHSYFQQGHIELFYFVWKHCSEVFGHLDKIVSIKISHKLARRLHHLTV